MTWQVGIRILFLMLGWTRPGKPELQRGVYARTPPFSMRKPSFEFSGLIRVGSVKEFRLEAAAVGIKLREHYSLPFFSSEN